MAHVIDTRFDSTRFSSFLCKEWSDSPLLRALRDHGFTVGPQRAQGLSGRSAPALAYPSSAPVQYFSSGLTHWHSIHLGSLKRLYRPGSKLSIRRRKFRVSNCLENQAG